MIATTRSDFKDFFEKELGYTAAAEGDYEPPKLCTRWWKEFSKQRTLKSFFAPVSPSKRQIATAPLSMNAPKRSAKSSGVESKRPVKHLAGQTSLTSFFKPAASSAPNASQSHNVSPKDAESPLNDDDAEVMAVVEEYERDKKRHARDAWAAVPFGQPPPAPLCHHNEPTKLFTGNEK